MLSLYHTWSWDRAPCSSTAFKSSRPNMILMRCAAFLVGKKTRHCSLKLRLQRARSEETIIKRREIYYIRIEACGRNLYIIPVIIASLSFSFLAFTLTNSCRRLLAMSVLPSTNTLTGWLRLRRASSSTYYSHMIITCNLQNDYAHDSHMISSIHEAYTWATTNIREKLSTWWSKHQNSFIEDH